MAEIGNGYGSECHLLRYLGRHRSALDARVLQVTGAQRIEWLDFGFNATKLWGDGELTGIGFVESPTVQAAWTEYWPQRGNAPNWDAVAKIERDGQSEWLLVEAKGNLEEIGSSCAAQGSGRLTIAAALNRTKSDLGVAPDRDWMNGHYQFANRVAVLNFLTSIGVPARLLFIYFVGDRTPGRSCPQSEGDWSKSLEEMDFHIGLPSRHPLSDRIQKLFLQAHAGSARPTQWKRPE